MIGKYIRYLQDNPQGYWFKAKLYGWGWVPATWQGWLLTLVYVLVVILLAMTIDENSPAREVVFTFILPAVILTITFVRICYKKGEKPSWHWGVSEKNNTKK